MNRIFSTLLTMSIGAAWLILIVILLRLLLKQAPKWVNCVLWGFVGLRLVCPFVPESRFSLMPGVFRMQNRYGNPVDLTFAQTPAGGGNLSQTVMDGTFIFLVSDGSYQDGDHTYAMSCDVYRVGEDAAPFQTGSLESAGTAYPLCAGADGFYVTSGHSIEVYNMDAAGSQLVLTQSHTEVYDENGNATYYRLDSRGQSVESTEEEYLEAWDRYDEEASPIEFTVQK